MSNINDCGPTNPCSVTGRDNSMEDNGCKDLVNDYECICLEGYGGKKCDVSFSIFICFKLNQNNFRFH